MPKVLGRGQQNFIRILCIYVKLYCKSFNKLLLYLLSKTILVILNICCGLQPKVVAIDQQKCTHILCIYVKSYCKSFNKLLLYLLSKNNFSYFEHMLWPTVKSCDRRPTKIYTYIMYTNMNIPIKYYVKSLKIYSVIMKYDFIIYL